jgi:hypothetical protein
MFDWLIYAYGNSYNGTLYAIKTVSAILTSTEFKVLMAVIFVVAVVVSLLHAAIMAVYQHKVTHTWILNLFFGALFMLVMITPTGTVTVQDTDNRSPSFGSIGVVSKVPFAVALPAWFMSSCDNAIKTLVNKYASPIVNTVDYKDIGGELSYNLLLNMSGLKDSVKKVAPTLYQYTYDYMKSCVNVGISQGWMSQEKLEKPDNMTLWARLEVKKKIPLFGFPADKEDCSTLYSYLKTEYAGIAGKLIINDYCLSNGYGNVGDTACTGVMKGILKNHFGKGSTDADLYNFLAGYTAVDAGKSVVQSYMAQAEKQVDVSNAMAAFQADKWLPKLRSSTMVAVILLAPFCFFLIFFSPGGVIKWYGGMYVWLILWSGIDQMFYMKYQNDIYDAYKAMRSSGLGINDMLNIYYPLLEPLGMYGKMRWISMTLALAMCMGILKIGNYAMASIAEGMGQVMQQTGSQTADKLSQVGGTAAAQDQYIREKARGWAADRAAPRAIENQVIYDYQLGIETPAQKLGYGINPKGEATANAINQAASIAELDQKIASAGSPEQYVKNMADFGTYRYDENMSMFETLKGHFGGNAQEAARAMGAMQANNQYIGNQELNSMINAMGGIQNLADAKGDLSAASIMENVSRYNTLKSMFNGDAKQAYTVMGQISGESSYIGYKELQAMKGLYGDNAKELADAKAFMATFNHLQTLGGIDAVKDKMNALDIGDVRQFSEFAGTEYTLNAAMAGNLNSKFHTSGFRENQKISFNANSDGGISNVVATGVFDSNNNGNVAGHYINGTETITFANDGGILQRSYAGSIDGTQGSLLTDGSGNQLFYSSESGSRSISYDVIARNISHGSNVDEATARSILANDTLALENLVASMKANNLTNTQVKDGLRPFQDALSGYIGRYTTVTASDGARVSLDAAMKAYVSGSVSGKKDVGSAAIAGTAGLDASITGSAGIHGEITSTYNRLNGAVGDALFDFYKGYGAAPISGTAKAAGELIGADRLFNTALFTKLENFERDFNKQSSSTQLSIGLRDIRDNPSGLFVGLAEKLDGIEPDRK